MLKSLYLLNLSMVESHAKKGLQTFGQVQFLSRSSSRLLLSCIQLLYALIETNPVFSSLKFFLFS